MALPSNMYYLTPEKRVFLAHLILEGVPRVKQNQLSPAAMVACAAVESGWGTSEYYKGSTKQEATNCPFNLQKFQNDGWDYPRNKAGTDVCRLIPANPTDNAGGHPSTFLCCAEAHSWGSPDLDDAARLWCEWIIYNKNKGAAGNLRSLKGNPTEFTRHLVDVNFGVGNSDSPETRRRKADDYARVLTNPIDLIKLCEPQYVADFEDLLKKNEPDGF
jgi:hypothetical protein